MTTTAFLQGLELIRLVLAEKQKTTPAGDQVLHARLLGEHLEEAALPPWSSQKNERVAR